MWEVCSQENSLLWTCFAAVAWLGQACLPVTSCCVVFKATPRWRRLIRWCTSTVGSPSCNLGKLGCKLSANLAFVSSHSTSHGGSPPPFKSSRPPPVGTSAYIFNLINFRTRAVTFNDSVIPASDQSAFFVMQSLNIGSQPFLMFYDSGANTRWQRPQASGSSTPLALKSVVTAASLALTRMGLIMTLKSRAWSSSPLSIRHLDSSYAARYNFSSLCGRGLC